MGVPGFTERTRTTAAKALGAVVAVALSTLGLLAVLASPTAALEQPDTIDLDTLEMVPKNMWGVSGQNPNQTQTESLDVLVYDFAQSGNYMFVGGAFLNVQENKNATPISQAYVAAFDIYTGDWIDTWTPTIDRAVYALDVLPNDSLLVGGEFENVNGTSRRGLVALDPITGAIDPTFAGAVDRPWSSRRATVRDMKVEPTGPIYVAGNFSHLDGAGGSRTQVSKAGRFANAAGVLDATWKPQVSGGAVWGLDTDRSRNEVALSGFFTSVNGEANTGHFHVVDDNTGATVAGKIERLRNYTPSQPEVWDVVYGDGLVFAIGEQHVVQVLEADNHNQIGYHHTGVSNNGFAYQGGFAGGAYQAGEKIGNIVFAGCHCTHGSNNHYESFTGRRTTRRTVMAYDATTGHHLEQFNADVQSPRDGFWAAASSTNGCLYLGGDYHVGGTQAGQERWLGGFAKLCSPRPTNTVVDPGDQATILGQTASLQIDANVQANLVPTYTASGLPAGLSIDTPTGLITGTPTDLGSSTVTVVVGDQGNEANEAQVSFEWSVMDNQAPELRQQDRTVVLSDNALSIQLVATDAEQAPFQWQAQGLPGGAELGDDGKIVGTPQAGSFNVTVTVTDAVGLSDTMSFQLVVIENETISGIESYSGYSSSSGNYFMGWQFTVDETKTIADLGALDSNGNGVLDNAGPTTVAIYDKATQSLLGQVDVPSDAPIEGGFGYASLAQPITVEPGKTYVVAAEVSGERYAYYGNIQYGDGVNYAGYAYKSGAGIGYPTNQGAAGPYYFGGTFRTRGDRPVINPGGDTLLTRGSTWRFDDSGTDLGSAWRQPAFDDGAWSTGAAELGFGEGDEATTMTPGSVTYYARTNFEFSGTKPNSLQLDLKVDDGAIVYLNGTEVLRDNMPEGVIGHRTGASTFRVGPDEDFRTHLVPASALVDGNNVLAVEVHNIWAGSSDLSFEVSVHESDEQVGGGGPGSLVDAGAVWLYADSSNGEPAAWKQGLAGAATGTAEFGFGDDDETTALVPGQETYYFTRTFEVDDPADFDQLQLGLAADDGAVVYLNGIEVQRVRMPEGAVTFDTRPTTWAAGADERLVEYTIPSDALQQGENIIAVEVHNLWPGNNDLSFDLYLQ